MDDTLLNCRTKSSTSVSHQIDTVRWDVVPSQFHLSWQLTQSTVVAIWPTPCPSCHCMTKAGFPEFSPVDNRGDEWDSDWRQMMQRLLGFLEHFGAPTMRVEVEAYEVVPRSGFAALLDFFPCAIVCGPHQRRLSLSILEQLLLTVDDDQYGEAVVDFGTPASISLCTGFGHPIFWLSLPGKSEASTLEAILTALAEGRRVEKTAVRWDTWFNDPRD